MSVALDVAPPPQIDWGFFPEDPSIFETVAFYPNAYDPAFQGISGFAWEFGDGGTSVDSNPTHTYATDGDYNVTLTVSTPDGRSAAQPRTVSVRTRDVAISKFFVPTAAEAGQTRSVSVGVVSRRYTEYVQVDLYASVVGGYQWIATQTFLVPKRSTNRTTDFIFNYKFTPADAMVGKVTFKVVATIVGARDVLPADNEAVSLPTKVRAK